MGPNQQQPQNQSNPPQQQMSPYPQPAPPQQQFAAPPQQQPYPQNTQMPYPQPQNREDPGQILGIVGLVMIFIGLNLVGLILGILSRKRSKAAGFSGTLGTIAIIINAVVMAFFALLVLPVLILTTFSGIQSKAKDTANQTNARSIVKSAEAYAVTHNNTYPTYAELVKIETLDSTVKSSVTESSQAGATRDKMVTYTFICDKGVTVSHWSSQDQTSEKLTAGQPESCI